MRSSKKILACFLAAGMVITTGTPWSGVAAQAKTKNSWKVVHRIIQDNQDGLIHYAYEDAKGSAVTIANGKAEKKKLRKAVNLPSSYNLNAQGKVSPIRSQGGSGACWAFAAIKAAESNSILKKYETPSSADFSENHLAWYTYGLEGDTSKGTYGDGIQVEALEDDLSYFFPNFFYQKETSAQSILYGNSDSDVELTPYNLGGNAEMAVSTLASWKGVEAEKKAPFNGTSSESILEMAKKMQAEGDSLKWDSKYHLQNALCYDEASLDEKKEAIMKYGAMDVSMYYDKNLMYETSTGDFSYYQTRRDKDSSNHCVTIVGWDDNYSDFRTRLGQAPKKGAWLIANSYGTDYSKSKEGYFWLSYEDASLCDFYTFDLEKADNYDDNYQYDGNGYNNYLTNTDDFGNVIDDSNITLSNVYQNESSSDQEIKAVGFYTENNNQPYKISVYRNVKGKTPDTGTLVSEATVKGTEVMKGYHTVSLAKAVKISSHSKFAVVVSYLCKNADGEEVPVYAPIEGPSMKSTDYELGCTQTLAYASKQGQSFWSDDDGDTWTDCYTGNSANTYNNACIKAFANDVEDNSEVSPEPAASAEPTSTTSPTEPATSAQPDVTTPFVTTHPEPLPTPEPSTEKSDVTKVSLSKKKVTLGKGEKISITIKTTPSAKQKQLSYISNDEKVATLDATGKIQAKGVGTAVLFAMADSNVYAQITVTVKKAPKSILLNAKSKKLKKGKKFQIKYTLPKGSASYRMTYSSSNTKIASVSSSGLVKAKKKGTAKVTVKTFNGIKKYMTIKVTNK